MRLTICCVRALECSRLRKSHNVRAPLLKQPARSPGVQRRSGWRNMQTSRPHREVGWQRRSAGRIAPLFASFDDGLPRYSQATVQKVVCSPACPAHCLMLIAKLTAEDLLTICPFGALVLECNSYSRSCSDFEGPASLSYFKQHSQRCGIKMSRFADHGISGRQSFGCESVCQEQFSFLIQSCRNIRHTYWRVGTTAMPSSIFFQATGWLAGHDSFVVGRFLG